MKITAVLLLLCAGFAVTAPIYHERSDVSTIDRAITKHQLDTEVLFDDKDVIEKRPNAVSDLKGTGCLKEADENGTVRQVTDSRSAATTDASLQQTGIERREADNISNGAMHRNGVPCSHRNSSYNNCRPNAESGNPKNNRGCEKSEQCKGNSSGSESEEAVPPRLENTDEAQAAVEGTAVGQAGQTALSDEKRAL